jgi:hypothetical protein
MTVSRRAAMRKLFYAWALLDPVFGIWSAEATSVTVVALGASNRSVL